MHKNTIRGWIPGWNLKDVLKREDMEYHMNGWALPRVKIAV
jgi:hypothetical protein